MIKFFDLQKINKPYENAFQNKLKSVLDNGWYILGDEVKLFEKNFADYCAAKHYVGEEILIHYPVPTHKQKSFENWNNLSFPITEKIHNEVLSLPISPVMTEKEVDFMIQKLNSWTY